MVDTNLGAQDTRTGTVLREGFLAPMAEELSEAYTNIDQVEANQDIANPTQITSAAMLAVSSNFGVVAFPGMPSSGVAQFLRFQVPPTPIPIPSGTIISVSGPGDTVSFATLGSTTLSSLSNQDPITGAYYVNVPAECTTNGSVGNVVAGSIAYQPIAGIDAVTNPNDFTGGTDVQTNTQIASVVKGRAQGNLGTQGGYSGLILSNFSLTDLAVVTPTDPEAVRAQFGGETDIIILDTTYIQSQDTAASSIVKFFPSFLPLISVDSITGFDLTNTQQTLVPGTDYDVVLDTYSPLSRSENEKSYINFHVTSFSVLPNSIFTILYRNCQDVRVIQAFIDDVQYDIVGSDVLIKLANQVGVNVTANIHITPGFDPTATQQNATNAVQAYLNSLLLGDSAFESDVIVAMSVPGVSSVDTSTFEMATTTNPLVFLDSIVVDRLSYIRAGTVTITVS